MNKTVEQIQGDPGDRDKESFKYMYGPGDLSGAFKDGRKGERDPQDTGERQKAVLYQCRISDRKASFQQPDQFRTL